MTEGKGTPPRLAMRALAATAALRIFCSAFAWHFAASVTPNAVFAASNGLSNEILGPSDGWRYLILGIWQRFDTLWYLHIAAHGYDKPAATVFYPLYPLLIRILSIITRDATAAALAISTVATFFLFWGIQKLAIRNQPATVFWSACLLAIWPTAFVFFAAYPDSLAIALVVWSVHFARGNRWLLAGLLAFFAGLAKAAGLLACVPLAVLIYKERQWKALAALALSPSGFLGFAVWLRVRGFPSPSTVYATYWRTEVTYPWNTLSLGIRGFLADGSGWSIGLNFYAIVFCVLILCKARNRRADDVLFSIGALTLFLTKETVPPLQSTSRYLLLVFPMFLYASRWMYRPYLGVVYLLLSFPLYIILLRLFLDWTFIV